MRHLSRHTLARAAAVGGIMALAVGFAPAAGASPAAQTSVPCSTTALASAIAGAASGDTLVLTSGCTYQVSDPLPGIAANLTIDGREATLDGDGPESVGYSLLDVAAGVTLHVRNLNFTCGGDYTGQCGHAIGNSGNVTIDGGTFYHLGPIFNEYGLTDGGAIGNGGQATLRQDTLSGNSTFFAFTAGGAIYNTAALTVTSTAITGNTAAAGSPGGIDNEGGAVSPHHDRIRSNTPFNCSNVPGCTD